MNRGVMRFQRTRFVIVAILMLLLMAVIVTFTGGTAVAQTHTSESVLQKLDPALQALIAEQTSNQIPIIVQKEADDTQVEQLLHSFGGTINQDLYIINAFATELDAASILALAKSPAVAHISLDAEVESSEIGDGINLLQNPDFESGFVGWNVYGDTAVSGDAYSGSNALETNVGAFQNILVNPGETLTFSLWAKRLGDPGWAGISLEFYNADGYAIRNEWLDITKDYYDQYVIEQVVPSTAYYVASAVWTGGVNGTILIDDASLIASNSTSVPDNTNLLPNGGFESGLYYWNYWGIVRPTGFKTQSGDKAVELGYGSAGISQFTTITPDQQYRLTGWYNMPSNNVIDWSSVWLDFYDANWNYLTAVGTDLQYSMDYAPFAISGVAPQQSAYIVIWIGKDGSGKLYLDDLDLSMESSGIDLDAVNMLDNGSFNNGEKYWGTWGEDSTTTIVNDSPVDNTSLKINGFWNGNGVWQQILAGAGEEYTYSGWVKVNQSWNYGVVSLDYYDENNNFIAAISHEIYIKESWTPFQISGIAPEGTAYVNAEAWLSGCQNCSLLVDDLSLKSTTTSAQPNDYLQVTGVDQLHDLGLDGSGVTVAVLDSGMNTNALRKATKAGYNIDLNLLDGDGNGHGTFMAGLIAGGATDALGNAIAVAPGAEIINVQVLDKHGKGSSSNLIAGLQWILENKDNHNIRVVNMSLSGPVTDAYWNNPINQAVEQLWAEGIVVVTAAGNSGPAAGSITTPGNDPFVITVGAFTDNYSPLHFDDDYVPPFSASGPSEAGFVKPDVLAPGAHLLMYVGENSDYAQEYPQLRRAGGWYQGSGTSAATAVTSGVVALMLQENPNLTPNEVKYRLMVTARPSVNNDATLAASIFQQGAGRIWAPEAVLGDYPGAANGQMIPGEAYVGPVIYDETRGGYALVDANRNPLPEGEDFFWDGGNFWAGGNLWAGGNFWAGTYFENEDYYWNSSLYAQDNTAVDKYQIGFMAQQP